VLFLVFFGNCGEAFAYKVWIRLALGEHGLVLSLFLVSDFLGVREGGALVLFLWVVEVVLVLCIYLQFNNKVNY
jgi:hypothetical protein